MEPRPLSFLAAACDGELRRVDPSFEVTRIGPDTRDLRRGELFVALSGARFDGHGFVAEALRRGAAAAVVARDRAAEFPEAPLVVVSEPRIALGRMAGAYRGGFGLPVVAVAGSNGKTTTKELLAATLGGCFDTLSTRDSFNNDVGVPLTLLGIERRHLAAVVEVGTNHPGELAPLVRMTQPRIGVLTHIGEEHLEFFGSVAGVIEEEGWLADLLPPDGVLVLPGDAPWTDAIVRRTRARVVRTGIAATNDWRLLEASADAEGTTFAVRAPRPDLCGAYRINLFGRHQVSNALLTLAAAAEFGLDRAELQRGLARAEAARWRMNRWRFEGVEVIEDCYNANPDSTLAALESLRAFPCVGRRVAVIGAMAELGTHTTRAHERVGRRAAELGLDRLLAVGEPAAASVEAAVDAGLASAVAVDAVETAAAALRTFLRPGDALLIKGSRSARLERLGPLLRDASRLLHAA